MSEKKELRRKGMEPLDYDLEGFTPEKRDTWYKILDKHQSNNLRVSSKSEQEFMLEQDKFFDDYNSIYDKNISK